MICTSNKYLILYFQKFWVRKHAEKVVDYEDTMTA